MIEEEEEEQPTFRSFDSGFGWRKYQKLQAIYEWLDQLLVEYPNVLTNYVYGKSYEGRPLRAIKVSHKEVKELCTLHIQDHASDFLKSGVIFKNSEEGNFEKSKNPSEFG